MFTFPSLRPRVAAHAPQNSQSAGAQQRINDGLFGMGVLTLPQVNNPGGPFLYHEGDLFTPGAENFVPEYGFELPVLPIWGHGMMALNPQQFNPLHPGGGYVFAPATTPAGLGGQITGGIDFTGLEVGASSFVDYSSQDFAPQL